jgi:hypothetical protein
VKKLAMLIGAGVHNDRLTGHEHIVLRLPLVTFDANKVTRGKKKR